MGLGRVLQGGDPVSQDRRYARGAEDAQEFIARLLERMVAGAASGKAVDLPTTIHLIRSLPQETIRGAMEADDAWMRKVAERELERMRAGWRDRTAAYQERQRLRTAGEDVPPMRRGRKKGGR